MHAVDVQCIHTSSITLSLLPGARVTCFCACMNVRGARGWAKSIIIISMHLVDACMTSVQLEQGHSGTQSYERRLWKQAEFLRHGRRLYTLTNTICSKHNPTIRNSLGLTMEPSAPSPEYLDAVDVLKEQERQIRELQDKIKSKEKEVDEKRKSLEEHAVAVNKEMVKNKELERDVRRLKRKVEQWEKEEEDHCRRVKQIKIERERREKMEADIKVKVRIEEYERERVRDEIFRRRQRRRYRK